MWARQSSARQWRVVPAGLVLLSGTIAGCTQSSTAAPTTVICGHKLPTSFAGAFVIDGTHGGVRTVTETSPGGLIQVRLSSDCSHGAVMHAEPQGSIRTIATAPASDGHLAGVELRLRRRTADILIAHPNGRMTRLELRLHRG